ncbi:unnamed protein product [Mytilus coruscus]|uniref:Uncharacterized protein n=1 Tax=Mytilus coruscus TaxID=42192 RepID=A0A6J8AKM9_MYTCO|nr:unnamed protein product [Mytilus coruscus]
MCRSKRNTNTKRSVNTLENSDFENNFECQSKIDSSSDDEYVFGLQTESTKGTVNSIKRDQPRICVKINESNINVLIDTGSRGDDDPVNKTNAASLKPSETNSTGDCTGKNCTKNNSDGSLLHMFNNKPMLMRAFYVLFLAVTSIVIVYFVVRAWRIRRKRIGRNNNLFTGKMLTFHKDRRSKHVNKNVHINKK